ncbi:MAG: MTH938/NDUFAF3 family protein [Isosphaeraceae bacterium]
MEVEGLGRGRDFKLYPGGGREWDWTETNTHHVPGIQPTDVQELLERGSKVVVLSRGMQLVLQTCPETLQTLQDKNIRVFVEETRAAVEIYNKLVKEQQLVGGLFHSTC